MSDYQGNQSFGEQKSPVTPIADFQKAPLSVLAQTSMLNSNMSPDFSQNMTSSPDQNDKNNPTVSKFLQEHQVKLKRNFVNDSPSEITLILDSLTVLLKVLGPNKKIKDLTIRQIFQFTHKEVEYSEEQIMGQQMNYTKNQNYASGTGSPNDTMAAPRVASGGFDANIIPEFVDIRMFNCTPEMLLAEIDQDSDVDDSDESVAKCCGDKKAPSSAAASNKYASSYMFHVPDPDDDDVYTLDYKKAKKLFRRLHTKTQDMRHEQIQYIINSLKMLILFLQVAEKMNLNQQRNIPNKQKLNSFLVNLDQRLKLTIFVMIQRIDDDEKLQRVAQEVKDSRKLVQDCEKNNKHMRDKGIDGGGTQLMDMYEKKLKKDKLAMEKMRYQYDQYGKKITHVDMLFFNNFSLLELCKLRLDFLAFLTIKKDNFTQMNQLTKIEMIRFKQQVEKNYELSEHIEEISQNAQHLISSGGLLTSQTQDPIKMYFEMRVKDIILSNRICGPVLAQCSDLQRLMKKFFTTKNNIKDDVFQHVCCTPKKYCNNEEEHEHAEGEGHTHQHTIPSPSYDNRNYNGSSVSENTASILKRVTQKIPEPRESDQGLITFGIGEQLLQKDGVIGQTITPPGTIPVVTIEEDDGITANFLDEKNRILPIFKKGMMEDAGHHDKAADKEAIEVQTCSSIISCDTFVNSMSQMLFQNCLPKNIKSNIQAHLCSLVGKQPSQFVHERFQTRNFQSVMPSKNLGQVNHYESQQMSGSKTDKKHKSKKSVVSVGIDTDGGDFLGLGPYDEMQHGGDEDINIFNFSEAENMDKIRQQLKNGINQPSEMGDPLTDRLGETVEGGGDDEGDTVRSIPEDLTTDFKGGVGKMDSQGKLFVSQFGQSDNLQAMQTQIGSSQMINTQRHATSVAAIEKHNTIHSSQMFSFTEQYGSKSICVQDFLLLTDFVPLAELVSILARGHVDEDIRRGNGDMPLLTIEKIENLLIEMGKNELSLLKDNAATPTEDWDYKDRQSSQITYEMNSFGIQQSNFDKLMQSSGQNYLDQDLLIVIILCGLFETKSISQETIAPELPIEQFIGTESPRQLQVRQIEKLVIQIEFDQIVEEFQSEPTLKLHNEMIPSALHSARSQHGSSKSLNKVKDKEIQQNSASQMVLIIKNCISGQAASSHTLMKNASKNDVENINGGTGGGAVPLTIIGMMEPRYNLMHVLNHLMIHQRLQRMRFSRMAIMDTYRYNMCYQRVFQIQRQFINQHIIHLQSLAPAPLPYIPQSMQNNLPCRDDDWGISQIYDFSFMTRLVQIKRLKELNRNKDNKAEYWDITQPTDNSFIEHQDFLEYKKIDQEDIMADNSTFSSIGSMQERQRFLQWIQFHVETQHINNENFLFSQKMEFMCEKKALMNRIAAENKGDQRVGQKTGKEKGNEEEDRENEDLLANFGIALGNSAPPLKQTEKLKSQDSFNSGVHTPLLQNAPKGRAATLVLKKAASVNPTELNKRLSKIQPMSPPQSKFAEISEKISEESDCSHSHDENEVDSKVLMRKPTLAKRANHDQNMKPSHGAHFNSVQIQYQDPVPISCLEMKKMESNPTIIYKAAIQLRKRLIDKVISEGIHTDYKMQQWYHRICYDSTNTDKQFLIQMQLNKIEELLYACDLQLLKQRQILVTMLKSVENGMEDRENDIKMQLQKIAILEMERGKDEDVLLDQTLKAVERINIADIAMEKDNLQTDCDLLFAKQAELDKIEDDLHKDKAREKARERNKAAGRRFTVVPKKLNTTTINKSAIVDLVTTQVASRITGGGDPNNLSPDLNIINYQQ